jgi:hypothetical protein
VESELNPLRWKKVLLLKEWKKVLILKITSCNLEAEIGLEMIFFQNEDFLPHPGV